MRKYIEVAKVLFKAQIVYRFATMLSMVFTISKIVLAYILWSAVFGEQTMVAGFTFNGMLSYYIISSFITQLDQSGGTAGEIADRIRTGSFSTYMVRPISVFGNFFSETIGISAFLMGFNLIAAVVWIFIFQIQFVITGSIVLILSALTIIPLGILFMFQLNYYIGILAFKFLEIRMFNMIKYNILEFITGSLIPLALLPDYILNVMRYFPFYYVVYLPSMLLICKNQGDILMGILVLCAWNAAFYVLNKFTYNKLRVKYDGVGI